MLLWQQRPGRSRKKLDEFLEIPTGETVLSNPALPRDDGFFIPDFKPFHPRNFVSSIGRSESAEWFQQRATLRIHRADGFVLTDHVLHLQLNLQACRARPDARCIRVHGNACRAWRFAGRGHRNVRRPASTSYGSCAVTLVRADVVEQCVCR